MKLLKKKSSPATPENTEKPMYTDLRQVMDYTRDFSMFYSGVEYEVYLDGCYNMGVRNFLMSYEYLKGKGSGQIKKYTDMHLFIDSGAFTYMADPKYQAYTVEQWENQIKEYLTWAEKHKNSIFAMAELDLQLMLGLDVINDWRKRYFEPFMLRTGIPVCFVYHDEGLDVWEKMCQRYPYVGFSSITGDGSATLPEYKRMLSYAEKYNSLVHGFGMTRTSLLPELPYYTVDSTSWKSGFRYGQLAIWNGKKVQMFKKEDWETKVFKYLDNYPDITFDKEKLYDYYEPEVLRANVYAYMRAEEYIIERQKPITYWKKAKTEKRDLNNLPEDFFPTAEWLMSGNRENLTEYCNRCNINPDYEQARIILFDVTAFLNWNNPDYKEVVDWYFDEEHKGTIEELHDLYINRIVPSQEDMIKDLIKFFKSCVSGENDRLLQLGTNFDRIVKERDEEEYVTEEETELVDISQEEIHQRLQMILPDKSSGDTVQDDLLNEEICRQIDVVPTFDEHGKFVKGQVAVRKPKQVYSKKFPKLACDRCFAAANCPEFKAGYVCAYNKMFDRFSSRDMGDVIQSMQGIVDYNMSRMQRAMIMETLSGGFDPVVTQLMDTNIRYMQMLKQMYEVGSPEVLRQTKVIRADGSAEETTTLTNPQSGGIMEKLFGKMMQSQPNEENIVEVTSNESEDSKTNN